jgi:glycosyltransferase involved in cell wall biosynthesis
VKRVLIDSRFIGGEISGIAKFLLMMLKGLSSAARKDIRFFLLAEDEAESRRLIRGHLGETDFSFIEASCRPFSFREQFVLPRVLRKNGIDIFYTPYANIPFFSGVRSICTFHDLIPLLHPEYVAGTRKGRYSALFRLFNYLAVRRSHSIVVVSETTKKDFVGYYGEGVAEKVCVVYEGIESMPRASLPVSESIQSVSRQGPYVLYVGRQDPYKNIVSLIRAFAEVRRAFRDIRLVIAGKKDMRFFPQIEEEARRGAGPEAISFAGFVNEAELDILYSRARLLVNPSLYEGFSLPPLEAFLRGCPAVVSRIPVHEEVLGDSAVYCDPHSIGDIAEKIKSLLASEGERKKYAEKGRERIRPLTCARAAQALLQVFEKSF